MDNQGQGDNQNQQPGASMPGVGQAPAQSEPVVPTPEPVTPEPSAPTPEPTSGGDQGVDTPPPAGDTSGNTNPGGGMGTPGM